MEERANEFMIVLDDVSLVDMSFGAEFTKAIEEKTVAAQQAQRAVYWVQ